MSAERLGTPRLPWLPGRVSLPGMLVLLSVLCGAAGEVAAGDAEGQPRIDFQRDVRPILSDKCFQCHGPDASGRKGDLRLDVRKAVFAERDSGPLIVPGQPGKSELYRRLVTHEAGERMPPAKSGKVLTDRQTQLIERWIAEGAPWNDHWAYLPPQRPAVPVSTADKWSRNAIDRFILAKLGPTGLKPSPEADKITLVRRLYLDLWGLPPSPAEVDAFLADTSAGAYEKLVDRLLSSPHYGERWGRHWLDAARYADSDGFEKDKSRTMWFYRDYVLQAYNRDLPYDQFIIEQLAGDLLPRPTQDQIVATGFLRNAMLNEEGGVDPEQFRMDAMFDRMDALGKSVLGLTVQCAQCHSHKYDPFTQEEYYRLFAFLNNDHEAHVVAYTAQQQMQIADLTRQMREIEARLKERTPDWPARLARWEDQVRGNQPQWTVLQLHHVGDNGQRYIPQKDGSLLAQGYGPAKINAQFQATTSLTGVTALRLELLTDPNLPCQGPGRSLLGTCALSEIVIEAAPAKEPGKKMKLKIAQASADYQHDERPLEALFYDKTNNKRVTGPISFAFDGNPHSAWSTDAGPGRRNQPRKAVFQLESPVQLEGELLFTISLQQNHGGWNNNDHATNNLGRFRISLTNAPAPVEADPLPNDVREVLSIPRDQRTSSQQESLSQYWRTTVPEWKEAHDQLETLWKAWPAGTDALTLAARDERRETRLLQRGDWLKPASPVSFGTPAFLHPLAANSQDPPRLAFAKWLVDRRSPTTARVFINRVWQAYFGTGIVATPEDLGVQSEPPSHPELLDWLAVEFMDQGWRLKPIHRLIVTSATYRQSSHLTPVAKELDPANRWLARGPRFRVEGEIVRDIALAASGLLNPQVGGRSVMPPAPAFMFLPPASYGPFPWVDETGPDKYRRALYTFRRRSTPYPVLQAFDVPNADISCVKRLRSNSPLQALTSLNEPLFVESAQHLARKTLLEGGTSDAERVTFAFRRVLSRPPTSDEQDELVSLVEKQRQRLAAEPTVAMEIATGQRDPAKAHKALPTGSTLADWGAYTIVSRVLLNLDEALTKE